MRTKRTVAKGISASALVVGLVLASATPASAISVNLSLGHSAPVSVNSATNVSGNPTATTYRTTVSVGQPVQASPAGGSIVPASPAIVASLGGNGSAAESDNVAGTVDASVAILLQDVATAEAVGNGNVEADDMLQNGTDGANGDARAGLALNLLLGNVTDGTPDIGQPNTPSPNGSNNGSSAGNGSASFSQNQAASGNATGSGNGQLNQSSGQASGSASGNGSGANSIAVTPPSSGTPAGPVQTFPCSAAELLNADVVITGNGVAQVIDDSTLADATGVVTGTVIGKANLNLCTVSLNLNGLLNLNAITNQANPTIVTTGDVDGSIAGNATVNVSLTDIPNESGDLEINVDLDTDDGTPLLSIRQ